MDTIVQLAASALTIAGTHFYGNKSRLGPALCLASQVPWWTIMIHDDLWGLLPLNLLMLSMHAKNLWKWTNETNG